MAKVVGCFAQCCAPRPQVGYFDTSHLPELCCRERLLFHGNNIPLVFGLFQQDNSPCHSAKNNNNENEELTWPPNCPDLNPIKHRGIMDSVRQWGRAAAKGGPI